MQSKGSLERIKNMLNRIRLEVLCTLLIAAPLMLAGDFVKQLTPKDVQPGAAPTLPILPALSVKGTSVLTCAIPLKELRANNPRRIDPMSLPNDVDRRIDKGIAHPPPIPVCSSN